MRARSRIATTPFPRRHEEYSMEVDGRAKEVEKFNTEGSNLIAAGHFMSEEIADKLAALNDNWGALGWDVERRREVYRRNLDVRVRFLFRIIFI